MCHPLPACFWLFILTTYAPNLRKVDRKRHHYLTLSVLDDRTV